MDPSRQNVPTPIEKGTNFHEGNVVMTVQRMEEELDTTQRDQILAEFEKAVQKHD
jgi:hypothetical protein